MKDQWVHDPDAALDYTWDWTGWLAENETIASHAVEVEAGTVNIDSTTATGTTVTAWISGGAARETCRVRCRITTSQGRTDDRTIVLTIRER